MATTTDDKRLTRTSVNVPADQLARLRKLAEAEHRTLSQEVRRLIEQRVKEAA